MRGLKIDIPCSAIKHHQREHRLGGLNITGARCLPITEQLEVLEKTLRRCAIRHEPVPDIGQAPPLNRV